MFPYVAGGRPGGLSPLQAGACNSHLISFISDTPVFIPSLKLKLKKIMTTPQDREVAEIPMIDFALFESDPVGCAQKIIEACTTIGFFGLKNHGIPQEKVLGMFEQAKEYFALPLEEKQKLAITTDNFGYTAMHQELLDRETQKIGDYKESYQVGKFKDGKPIHALPEMFEKTVDELDTFMKSCHGVIIKLLQAFAIGLEIPESEGGKNWLSDRHRYDMPSGDVLRILHYPAVEKHQMDEVRGGSHTDYGSITLLFQHEIGGLEVQAGRERWISAPVIPGTAIINLGDCLEYWTNGFFKSTRHRVVFRQETVTRDRYSMVYFCQGYEGVSLDPIPSRLVPMDGKKVGEGERVITAADHLKMSLKNSYQYYTA